MQPLTTLLVAAGVVGVAAVALSAAGKAAKKKAEDVFRPASDIMKLICPGDPAWPYAGPLPKDKIDQMGPGDYVVFLVEGLNTGQGREEISARIIKVNPDDFDIEVLKGICKTVQGTYGPMEICDGEPPRFADIHGVKLGTKMHVLKACCVAAVRADEV